MLNCRMIFRSKNSDKEGSINPIFENEGEQTYVSNKEDHTTHETNRKVDEQEVQNNTYESDKEEAHSESVPTEIKNQEAKSLFVDLNWEGNINNKEVTGTNKENNKLIGMEMSLQSRTNTNDSNNIQSEKGEEEVSNRDPQLETQYNTLSQRGKQRSTYGNTLELHQAYVIKLDQLEESSSSGGI
ncbi:hypothetical protein HAX54_048481 [Datura stramonium]|uniref:Uncharacterized protein n=1 Tax=Datura stramonium TaxID=4076 RepID=A0ABS8RQF6_DATST|nr:hypothetical protein [Datura stramonium]